LAIRAYEPSIREILFRGGNSPVINLRDSRSPMKFHACFRGVIEEELMQLYASDGVARRAREICLGTMSFVDKPNPPERKGASLPQ
jgi:hypothetical protein